MTTQQGNLLLNDDSAGTFYVLIPDECSSVPAMRATQDDVPQASGSILHRRFTSGYVMQLGIQFWADKETPACDLKLRQMYDTLMLHLNALMNPTSGFHRVLWTPSGYSTRRMLDQIRLLTRPTQTLDGIVTGVTFQVESPFPYAIDLFQHDDAFNVTANHLGNTDFYPVIKVHGPADTFTLTNANAVDDAGTPLKIVYDKNLPGAHPIAGSHYVEIDCFRETVYLDGNQANRKPGIDVVKSDFWPLVPGPNALTLTGGGTAEILWNNAWA